MHWFKELFKLIVWICRFIIACIICKNAVLMSRYIFQAGTFALPFTTLQDAYVVEEGSIEQKGQVFNCSCSSPHRQRRALKIADCCFE